MLEKSNKIVHTSKQVRQIFLSLIFATGLSLVTNIKQAQAQTTVELPTEAQAKTEKLQKDLQNAMLQTRMDLQTLQAMTSHAEELLDTVKNMSMDNIPRRFVKSFAIQRHELMVELENTISYLKNLWLQEKLEKSGYSTIDQTLKYYLSEWEEEWSATSETHFATRAPNQHAAYLQELDKLIAWYAWLHTKDVVWQEEYERLAFANMPALVESVIELQEFKKDPKSKFALFLERIRDKFKTQD